MLQISDKELKYLHNQDFLITKRVVIDKIFNLFSDLEYLLSESLNQNSHSLPDDILKESGKVSKGENYKQLPYLVLDFPRCFKKNKIFSVRTMFWWGHFFSNTLHIQGEYLQKYRSKIVANYPLLNKHNHYICVNEHPWDYDYPENNYLLMNDLNDHEIKKIIQNHKFIKISRKFDLDEWSEVENYSLQFIKMVSEIIK